MRRRAGMVAAMVVAVSMGASVAARAAVRVDEDEVIFSLRAPAAREVYLVGDFNQWNPTVENMERDGDTFQVGLFLVAGSYRYKFVVDGKWIADPDNPGPSPGKGSPIVLVERSGGLVLSTELPNEAAPASAPHFGLRYIGRLTTDHADTDYSQRFDATVSASRDHLDARAIVAAADSTWSGSPFSVGAFFDRGRVDVVTDKLSFRGFENDTTWASSDPMHVVGDAGVYGYDAGFRRHGVSGQAGSSHVALRAMLADVVTRNTGTNAAAVDLSGFGAGARSDTTVYATGASFDGSDLFALEATATFGSTALGITRRDDRGVNPGLVAGVTRTAGGYVTRVDATRENRRVSSVWAKFDAPRDVHVTAAYGWGDTEAKSFAAAAIADTVPVPARADEATVPSAAAYRVASTERVVTALEAGGAGANASLAWDWTRFRETGVSGGAHADVHRVTVRAEVTRTTWSGSVRGVHTDARYHDTPDDLHIDWPARNPWLSIWDAFDAAELVGVGLESYSVYDAVARTIGRRVDVEARVLGETRDVAGRLAHAEASVSAHGVVSGPWYATGYGRWTWYDGPVGGGGDFLAGYLEGGYRHRWIDATLGFGFDPVVFDPVINDYADIGWTRNARAALDGGFTRSRAADLRRALVARERALSDVGTIKVEFTVHLP